MTEIFQCSKCGGQVGHLPNCPDGICRIESKRNTMNEDQCPRCGETIIYDEVDIGVGMMRGNACCDVCGWCMDDEIRKMSDEV